MNRLADRRALVTGAGSGIGRAIARLFAMEGAMVLAADLRGQEEVAGEGGGRILPCKCDVTDPGSVEAMVEECRSVLGGLDVLINNAGIGRGGKRIHETSLVDWDDVVNVNLRGVFLVLKHGLPLMMESGGGAVVNTASTAAFRSVHGSGAYTPTKAAVRQLTSMAALEYAGDGIRVNAIAPGPIRTPLYDTVPEEQARAMINSLPMQRIGTPEEVAKLALFLASDEASFITGATYLIDGGELLT